MSEVCQNSLPLKCVAKLLIFIQAFQTVVEENQKNGRLIEINQEDYTWFTHPYATKKGDRHHTQVSISCQKNLKYSISLR